MHRRARFPFCVLCLCLPGPVGAQTDQQFRQCNGADPALAIIGCTAVIESRDTLPPLRSHALANRAIAYMNRGQAERALPDLDRAIMLDNKNSLALVGRGNYFQAQGNAERALADYNQAISVNSKDASAFNQRGNFYLLQG